MISEKLIKGHLKPPKDFFKSCEAHFPIYDFKRSGKITRSSNSKNNRRVIKKVNIRKNTNFDRLNLEQHFVIYLATKKRIEVQSWVYYLEIDNNLNEELTFRLANLEHFSNNECHKASNLYTNRYLPRLLPWTFQSGPYTNAIYYHQNYEEVFKTSELRHFDIKPFTANQYTYKNLTRLYKFRHGLEFIQKMGGMKLFYDIVNGYADMRIVNKRFIRSNRNLIKKNLNFDEIYTINYLRSKNIEPNFNSLKYISGDLKLMGQYADGRNFGKLQNYLVKQKRNLNYYDDYISFLNRLEVPINSDQVRFPKDLEAAHDDRLQVLNMIQAEIDFEGRKDLELMAESVTKKLIELEKDLDNYSVVAPKNLGEIINEGSTLNHCVGQSRYLESHSKGSTVVLFLRKKGKEMTPFHTFSFDMKNKITQVQGYGNQRTDLRSQIEIVLKEQWLPFAVQKLENIKI